MESLDGPTLSGGAHRGAERHVGELFSRLVPRIPTCRSESRRTLGRIAAHEVLCSPDGDDAGDEEDDRSVAAGGPAREDQSDGGRCAGDATVLRRDWR